MVAQLESVSPVATAPILSKENVLSAVELIVERLGQRTVEAEQQALKAFHDKDFQTVKFMSLQLATNDFIGCLGYLASAVNVANAKVVSANAFTVLREAAKCAALVIAADQGREIEAVTASFAGEVADCF